MSYTISDGRDMRTRLPEEWYEKSAQAGYMSVGGSSACELKNKIQNITRSVHPFFVFLCWVLGAVPWLCVIAVTKNRGIIRPPPICLMVEFRRFLGRLVGFFVVAYAVG